MTFDASGIAELRPARAFSLEGKAAVVAGTAGGLGRWFAAGLGAAGAAVLATDVDQARLEDVVATLRDAGVTAESVTVDLRDDDAPDRIVSACVEHLGRLDVLVNNAAVNRRMPIHEMDRETYDSIMDVNLRLPYFLSQAGAGAMNEGGAIVNISSINFTYGLEHISVYGPAKAGLSQLTRVMALEWAAAGIRANCIAPGFFDTPLARPLWEGAETSRWLLNRVPLRRPGQPGELVGLCQLLASPA